MHLDDAIDWFLLGLKANKKSPDTVRTWSDALTRYLSGYAHRTGRTRLADLTPGLLRAAVVDILESPPEEHPHNWKGGQSMAATLVTAARCMARELAREGVQVADLSIVRVPQVPKRTQPRTSSEDFQAIEAALRRRLLLGHANRFLVARDNALVLLLSNTALRAAEVCRMNLQDVDLEAGTVAVWGKGAKPRELPIYDPDPLETDGGEAMRAMRDYLAYRQARFGALREKALWLTREGRRLRPGLLRYTLATLCREAGIENRPPHAFRRGWFTDQYRSDPRALPTLSARMGWSPNSTDMVATYTRGVDLELARAVPLPLNSRRWRSGVSPSPAERGSTVSWWREGAGPVDPRRRQASGAGPVPAPPERSRPLAQ